MLSPKRVKWRKQQKGKTRGKAQRCASLFFGEFGLRAEECGRISSRQIEAARVAMTRYTKRGGRVWLRLFPHKPVTKKPLETRMGSGKGNVEEWVAVIQPGRILYEMADMPAADAKEALRLASHKLPLKCKIVSKESERLEALEVARQKKLKQEKKAAQAARA